MRDRISKKVSSHRIYLNQFDTNKVSLYGFIRLQQVVRKLVQSFYRHNRKKGRVPVIASTGVSGYHNEAKVKGPGVVIGRSGSIGGGQFIKEDFWPLNTTLWVKDFKGHPERFVYYLLKSIDFSRYNSGAAVPSLNRNLIGHIEVRELGLTYEKKAALFISSIDELIESNMKVSKLLENAAQTIFKSWFVDFDPVHAKKKALEKGLSKGQAERAAMAIISGICSPSDFAGNFKEMDQRLTQKLSKMNKKDQEDLAHTASLSPSEFQDSELGEIPKNWKIGYVKNFSSVKAGYAFKSKDFQKTGFPVIKIKNINDSGRVSLSDTQYIPSKIVEKAERFKLESGDFLIAMTGAKVGKCGLVILQGKSAYLNQRVGKFEPHKKNHISYLYFLFMRNESQDYILSTAQGSAQPNISSDEIEKMRVVVPSNQLVDSFSKLCHPFLNKILIGEVENLSLSSLRDTLLPKLLAGEIDLSNIKLDENIESA